MSNETTSRTSRIVDAFKPHLIGLALCVVYVLILLRTGRHLGFARDEGFYFAASRTYADWFNAVLQHRPGALTRPAIDAAWGVNHEHPSLMKSLFGLSWLFLHEKIHLFRQESLAFRFPGMVMGGLGLWVTYLFGRRAWSHRVGLFAALALACMPRVFYHAHLDCFDVPVMTMWIAVLYCYWRSTDGGLRWALATGLMWGLALETKHNAWFVPFLVVAHFVVTRGSEIVTDAKAGKFPLPVSLLAMAVIGPAVFVALWPWMWFDLLRTPDGHPGRLSEYVGFHLNHAYYNMEFLGYNWFRPPFPRTYSWGMILFTVPGITLLLAVMGLGLHLLRGLREATILNALTSRISKHLPAHSDPRGTLVLVGMGFLVPLAPWFSTKTPIFGGTKHWFPAYPFLALMAGLGFAWVASKLDDNLRDRVRERFAWLPAAALGSVLLLPALSQTTHSHPFGLSNYTPIVGGAPGAADVGLNRQFWGFTTGSLVPWFNAHAPPEGAGVYIHDTTYESWEMLQRDGYLREDLRPVWQVGEGRYAIVHHELHMNEVDYQIWLAYGSPATAEVLTYDGVPIVSVYERPERR
ncbi:MAG: glycosyltransferase family 39 protein [Polyangiales bacterium]